jgi:hypothetical protein
MRRTFLSKGRFLLINLKVGRCIDRTLLNKFEDLNMSFTSLGMEMTQPDKFRDQNDTVEQV